MKEAVRELLRFLLVGFVAGWIAAILVRGHRRTRGCLVSTLIGMLGAVLGGLLLKLLGVSGVAGVVTAAIGAVALLVLARLLRTV